MTRDRHTHSKLSPVPAGYRRSSLVHLKKDIAEMAEEFRRKLAATESQLSAVVRSRLDGVKRSRDLIEESATQISKLHEQFAKMEE